MSDLPDNILPVASLIAGLSGSLHCLGMCGGLVTASCSGGKDVLKYQAGRLIGYLVLGSISFSLGYILKGVVSFSWGPLLSGLFMGSVFIFWGIRGLNGKKAELPLPGFLGKFYRHLYRNFVTGTGTLRAFVLGLISIMLPCGLIYGIILSALALGNYEDVMLSLGFFWLGTLPAMICAPQAVRRILEPLRRKLPRAYAMAFILIGVMTISARLMNPPGAGAVTDRNQDGPVHRCH